jgi:hypothetical protein
VEWLEVDELKGREGKSDVRGGSWESALSSITARRGQVRFTA